MAGVYVHIPFCEQKCLYCDFYSLPIGTGSHKQDLITEYFASVRAEAKYYRELAPDLQFDSLFFGGGTPTAVPADALGELIRDLSSIFSLDLDSEITVEANPNTVSFNYLQKLKDGGANRISLGIQALQDHLLEKIGRTHTVNDALDSVALVQELQFVNGYNLDLMFGLPEQELSNWDETLVKALELNPDHISCYSLIIEEQTPFFDLYEQGELVLPDSDLELEMYSLARHLLTSQGYTHYEISNFCKPAKESRHNLHYWRNNSYVGLGPSASGYLDGMRYTNKKNLLAYNSAWQKGKPLYESSYYTDQDTSMDETMMVGMRLLAGVSDERFRERFGLELFDVYAEQINDLSKQGLVEFSNGYLKVTERGLYLENQVSAAFLRTNI